MRYVLQMLALSGLAMGNAQAQTSDQMANAQRFDIPAAKPARPVFFREPV